MSALVTNSPVVAPLPFRLRTVLGVGLLALGVAFAVPRVKAAWSLHALVGKVADYGLCMAGPTGALAIRDDVTEFRRLVRRRLVSSTADDKPFIRCATLAGEISGRAELRLRHQQSASEFIEWGGSGQQQSLNELLGTLPDLVALHARSWPFARRPLVELVRPSRGAFEAVHPMDPPRPVAVRGLVVDGAVIRSTVENAKGRFLVLSNERDVWALRTRDRGMTWTPTSVWQSALDGHAHHCVADASSGMRFTLAPARTGASPALLLGTLAAMGTEPRELGTPNDVVERLACDATGAVTLTQRKTDGSRHVFACPLNAVCREVVLPLQAQSRSVSIDVARLARTIVLAFAKDGLVRVTSSRDEGASLTPLALVFDARDTQVNGLDKTIVPTLLAFEKNLELTLNVPGTAARWALGSIDFGASFRGL